jgi:SAM-dependent methyltransferase
MNVSDKSAVRPCPMCGHHDGFDHADTRGGEWHLTECAQCRFVYLQNPPAYEAFVEDFAWEKTFQAEKRRRFSEEPILSRLSQLSKFARHRIFKRDKIGGLLPRFVKSGPVLDVGCGSGHIVDRRFGQQYEPWGVEISKVLATRANELFSRRGGRCIHDNAKSGMSDMPSDFFTGITMLSYLEHEINPREVCKAAYRCLGIGGHLIVKVPNHSSWNRYLRGRKWCGYRFPDHVNYFTPASLSALMTDTGFSIVKFQWIDRLPISDNMWIVVQKS